MTHPFTKFRPKIWEFWQNVHYCILKYFANGKKIGLKRGHSFTRGDKMGQMFIVHVPVKCQLSTLPPQYGLSMIFKKLFYPSSIESAKYNLRNQDGSRMSVRQRRTWSQHLVISTYNGSLLSKQTIQHTTTRNETVYSSILKSLSLWWMCRRSERQVGSKD